MYENYAIAGSGMKKMFTAEVVAIASVVILLIPILGWIVGLVGMIVGFVLSLTGLYAAGPAHANFKNAFTITIANIVVSIIKGFMGEDSFLGAILGAVSVALGFLVVYFVCTAAAELLNEKGDAYQADRGTLIWKMYFVCAVIAIVCSVLAVIPIIGALAAVVALIASIVELVASILYMIFLYKASQSLLA